MTCCLLSEVLDQAYLITLSLLDEMLNSVVSLLAYLKKLFTHILVPLNACQIDHEPQSTLVADTATGLILSTKLILTLNPLYGGVLVV